MTLGRIGDYRVVQPLGSGGMGDVFFAVSPTAERVAVKVIRRQLVNDHSIRERFAAEVESLKLVYGSRVAKLEDADPYADPPWLAVEYVPGATLREHVDAQGPLPVPIAAMIGAMLADGLTKVHQVGLLHRDLKPQNIILGPDGPKLIDFGLAVLLDRDNYLTAPGVLVGTPAYMSPEQVKGDRDLTAAVDIYGLAAVMVHALTGHGLYPASNSWNLLLRITEPSDLPDMSGVPVTLLPLIGAMLAFDPGARPSLDAVRSRLLEVATSQGSPVGELRRQVAALTYDAGTELLIPAHLTDPERDPEAGTLTDPDPERDPEAGTLTEDADGDPPGVELPADPDPPAVPRIDVTWLVDKVRRQYARRSTLL